MKEENPKIWHKIHFICLALVLVVGVIIGANFFPVTRIVPVERVVEKVVDRRVEVPVDRVVEKIVEKRVEVPVDRVVEKVVEKRVEVPVERVVTKYVSERTLVSAGKPTYVLSEERLKLWKQIKVGMTRQQVVDILGPPDGQPIGVRDEVWFTWQNGTVCFKTISGGGTVTGVIIPEY